MEILVFIDAYAGSVVIFYFQGCHLFSNTVFLLNYGNPELKNMYFSYFIHNIKNWVAYVSNLSQKPTCFVLDMNLLGISGYPYLGWIQGYNL